MGQLGHGDLKSSNEPRRIAFFEERGLVVDYISCGGCHSAAVTRDGAWRCGRCGTRASVRQTDNRALLLGDRHAVHVG